jgi:septal ring factor EnvC (AmiA/AmiB activator)
MILSEDLTLTGLAATGTVVSACAVLLRSTHQNLKALDAMRREASVAVEKLRQELRHQDDTIFKLQELCADYRLAIAKLEAERDFFQRGLGGSDDEDSSPQKSWGEDGYFSPPDRPEHR